MARITIEDCLKKIPNRFDMTLAATIRARQIARGAVPMVEANRDKATVIALREMAAGKYGSEILHKNQPEAPDMPARAAGKEKAWDWITDTDKEQVKPTVKDTLPAAEPA